MKTLITVWLLASTSVSFAQDQAECARHLDGQMQEMSALTTAQADQTTYTKLFDRAKQCVDQGRCGKADAFISISEMMVDEKIIDIQRKKIAALKAFFIEAHPYQNDACALVKSFPEVLDKIRALNELQLERFIQLSEKQFPVATSSTAK